MLDQSINNDHDLIRELKKDNIEAFNQLFYVYSSKLYHFGYGYLKSKEDAEEMVQEIFSIIWDNRQNIKEEYQFRSYLFSIAFNYIKKYFRSKTLIKKYAYHHSSPQMKTDETSEEVEYASLKSKVDGLVDQMPEKRKAVFIKSRIEGKNAKEISVEMNISQSTVENHLNQALKFLRQQLNDENLARMLFSGYFFSKKKMKTD